VTRALLLVHAAQQQLQRLARAAAVPIRVEAPPLLQKASTPRALAAQQQRRRQRAAARAVARLVLRQHELSAALQQRVERRGSVHEEGVDGDPQQPLVLVGVLGEQLDLVPLGVAHRVQVLADDQGIAVQPAVHALVVDGELLQVLHPAERAREVRVLREREDHRHLAALARALLHRHLKLVARRGALREQRVVRRGALVPRGAGQLGVLHRRDAHLVR
jgi:hypothetical protein